MKKSFLPVQSLGRYIILKLCRSIAFLGKLKTFFSEERKIKPLKAHIRIKRSAWRHVEKRNFRFRTQIEK